MTESASSSTFQNIFIIFILSMESTFFGEFSECQRKKTHQIKNGTDRWIYKLKIQYWYEWMRIVVYFTELF